MLVTLMCSTSRDGFAGRFVSKLMHWLTQLLLCLPFFRVILGLPRFLITPLRKRESPIAI
jgi:hypothetical protein